MSACLSISPGEVGKLYNSGEIIEDILRVPAKKKKFEKEGDDIE